MAKSSFEHFKEFVTRWGGRIDPWWLFRQEKWDYLTDPSNWFLCDISKVIQWNIVTQKQNPMNWRYINGTTE